MWMTAGWRRTGALMRLTLPLIIVFLVYQFTDVYWHNVVVTVLISALSAMSLTALMGWAGQGSLLTAAVMLAGGYAVAGADALGVPAWLGIPAALLVGAVIGALVSLPARRLAGIYLLVATLGMSFVILDAGNLIQSELGRQQGFACRS